MGLRREKPAAGSSRDGKQSKNPGEAATRGRRHPSVAPMEWAAAASQPPARFSAKLVPVTGSSDSMSPQLIASQSLPIGRARAADDVGPGVGRLSAEARTSGHRGEPNGVLCLSAGPNHDCQCMHAHA